MSGFFSDLFGGGGTSSQPPAPPPTHRGGYPQDSQGSNAVERAVIDATDGTVDGDHVWNVDQAATPKQDVLLAH